MRKINIIGCLLLLSGSLSIGYSETISLKPIEQAVINGLTPNGEMEARLLIKFDFSMVPRDCRIVDATLYLPINQLPNEMDGICFYAALVTTEWNSDDVDWDGADSDADWEMAGGDWVYAYGDYGCLYSEAEASPRLNLTSLIRLQIGNPQINNGLILVPSEIPKDFAEYQIEIIDLIRPHLEIKYYPGTEGAPKPVEIRREKL